MFSKCVKPLYSTIHKICNVNIPFLVSNNGARLLEFPGLCSLRANLHESRSNLCVIDSFHHVDAEGTSFNRTPSDGHVQNVLAMRDGGVTHSHATVAVIGDFVPKKEPLWCLDFHLNGACMIAFNRCISEAVFRFYDERRLHSDLP